MQIWYLFVILAINKFHCFINEIFENGSTYDPNVRQLANIFGSDGEDTRETDQIDDNNNQVIEATQLGVGETAEHGSADEDRGVGWEEGEHDEEEGDDLVELMYNQKDKECLIFKCHIYNKKRENKNLTSNWRCSFKSCNKTLTTRALDNYTILRRSEDDHEYVPVNVIQVAILRAKSRMRERCAIEVHTSPKVIYN